MTAELMAKNSGGVYILWTVVIMLACAGLAFLLYLSVRKERVRFGESGAEKGVLNLASFEKFVNHVISAATKRTTFAVFQVDINDYENLIKSIGETLYGSVMREYSAVLSKLMPWGIKVAEKRKDCLLVYMRTNADFNVDAMSKIVLKNTAKKINLSGDMTVEITVNVAAAVYPQCGASFEEIDKNLELSMVLAKRGGINSYAVYTEQIGNSETEEYKFYQEIKDAMKDREFGLFYQPIVDSNNFEVVCAESLIRWNHKTKGVLSPAYFLHVMEKTGDINWVGFWCFEQMVRQAVIWRGNYEQKFNLNINLSERQLMNPNLSAEFRKIAAKFKANPNVFTMEITDMTLYFNSDVAKANIDRLAQDGFKICLDGYGHEFNDLTQLESLPLNQIKLDSKFWRKAEISSITENIVAMLVKFAREKGVMLVALGVENADEMGYLRSIGINYFQGYYFSPPKDAREFISDAVITPWASLQG